MARDLATIGFGREPFEPEHEAYRDVLRKFMVRNVVPNVKQWEKDGFFPAELFREAGKAGLLCASVPQEYGGGGGDMLHLVVLHEEHSFTPAVTALESGLLVDFVSILIHKFGTEEQRREWIPFFARGDGIAELGMSEPGAGSDVKGIRCHARRDGDDWILNGQKLWITNGPIMTVLFCLARTKPLGEHDGLTLFIVPMDARGVTVRNVDLMLKSCGGVGEIFLDDVRVPARNILGGEEGHGLKASLSIIAESRVAASARAIAASEVALEITLDFVKNRKAFGQAIFDFQNTQFKLASAATEIAAGRAYVDSAIRKVKEGKMSNAESAKVRLFCTEMEGRVMDECLQLHGGAGYSNEYIISKMYAFSRLHRIYGGTSEIMKTVIARSL